MEIKEVKNQQSIDLSKVREAKVEKKESSEKVVESDKRVKEERAIKDKYNDMRIRNADKIKAVKNNEDAAKRIKEVAREIRENKDSLKVMDRVEEIRDKALATLS